MKMAIFKTVFNENSNGSETILSWHPAIDITLHEIFLVVYND